MAIHKSIYIILALSILFTGIVQLDVTRAIFFDNYLNSKQVSGFNYYLSLINESSKGNWTLGSPYFLEWRYAPYLYPALNVNAAGLFKRILGLDVKFYALIMGYLAVFTIVVLLLSVFLRIFNFSYLGYLAAMIYIFYPETEWNRTLSPEINFIPMALFLVFYFYDFKFWKREIGLAILTGLLFYVYPYYWTFALALLGSGDLLNFLKVRKINWKYLYKYPIIFAIASWYAVHLWEIHKLPYYQETMARIGFLHSRWPAGWYTQAVLLGSLALFFLSKKYVFSKINAGAISSGTLDKAVAGLTTGLIVLNQQIITNIQMEFNSHYFSLILFFFIAFYGILIFILLEHFNSYKKILLAFFTVIAIGMAGNQVYWIIGHPVMGNFDPDISETYVGGRADAVVDWFLDNKIQDKVVYAPKDLGNDINLLTNNYLYFHPSQELQLMPTAELLDRYTYFDVVSPYITDNLLKHQTQIFGQAFNSARQKDNVLNGIRAKIFGGNFAPATLSEYTYYDFGPMLKKRLNLNFQEFNSYLKKYHVDYLIYRQADKNLIYKQVPGKIVFENSEFIIKKYE